MPRAPGKARSSRALSVSMGSKAPQSNAVTSVCFRARHSKVNQHMSHWGLFGCAAHSVTHVGSHLA